MSLESLWTLSGGNAVDELLQTAAQAPVERQEEFLRQRCAAAIPDCWRKSGRGLLLDTLRQIKIHTTPLRGRSALRSPFPSSPKGFSLIRGVLKLTPREAAPLIPVIPFFLELQRIGGTIETPA
jgi:hypothetical protein